ncbi:hypothetical protein BT63DRAFT_451858 [Microthyrium microscopicum]|uniref:Mid2 domain-containing protein n=1 Tax=Microthyrium microscopicum TaxID=703497 RepID=A0A6A6USA1_9PEZI|nr:hypothetical protein BT63DRAFT_451858 [Microthyrium microscopicum]
MTKLFFGLVAFGGVVVEALNAPLPLPTDNIANAMGFSPVPTAAPMVPDILKRAAGSGSLLGYYAPDNTCGYVSGIKASSKTCDSTELCAAVVVAGVASVGCCDPAAGTCQFQGNCVGSVGYYSSSLCGAACQADVNTIKCTAATKPYCYSFLVPGMTMGFYSCAATYSASFATFQTTFAGEVDGRSWSPLYDSGAGAATASGAKSSSAALILSTNGLNNAAGFASSAVASATGTASNAGSSSNSNSSNNGTIVKKNGVSVGAIVGGIIGGLVIIGAAVFAVIFLCIKKRNAKNNAPNANMAQHGVPQMVQPPMMGQPGYDPNQQQQGYGQNNGYFAPQGGMMTKDAKFDPRMSVVSSIPNSPAPAYNPAQSPPMPNAGVVPSPAMSHPSPAQSPPPGVYEAGGNAVQHQNFPPSPGMNAAVPVQHQAGAPNGPPNGAPAPVELGTTYAAPRQANGQHVFELQ